MLRVEYGWNTGECVRPRRTDHSRTYGALYFPVGDRLTLTVRAAGKPARP